MITIDLQDDEVTRAKKSSPREKDIRRESERRLDRTSTTGEQKESRLAKPGLIVRLLKMVLMEN